VNFFIGVTDYEWFQLHAAKQNVEEVNFWRPSPDKPFKVLQPGELLLFKLHSPRNRIAGSLLHEVPPASNFPGVGRLR
jgi:putative restriction endonuclease